MLVIPYKLVHVLLFSQPGLRGNARRYGNRLPEGIPHEKPVSVAEGERAKNVEFHTCVFEYSCDLLALSNVKASGTSSDNKFICFPSENTKTCMLLCGPNIQAGCIAPW